MPNYEWTLYCAALADYRTDRYESALDRLRRGREASKARASGAWPGYLATSYALEAMASARLDRADEACTALKQAESILATSLPAVRPTSSYLDSWNDWLHYEILVREARSEVADLDFPADPFAP
jgi:hypothetical protein